MSTGPGRMRAGPGQVELFLTGLGRKISQFAGNPGRIFDHIRIRAETFIEYDFRSYAMIYS